MAKRRSLPCPGASLMCLCTRMILGRRLQEIDGYSRFSHVFYRFYVDLMSSTSSDSEAS